MTFQEADYFNAIHGNQFIADLMPKHPVYVAMLSDSARSAIGTPHPSGRAAMRMLQAEGFEYEGYLDIFDGGPTMTAATDRVRSIAAARQGKVIAIGAGHGETSIIAAGRLSGFRSCFGKLQELDDGVLITHETADLLGVGLQDTVWWVPR